MNNYIEYNNKMAFHPGYYIQELVEDSGLTQEDFAKRLDTTPKNLSLLIRGEQNLSIDIAVKLARLFNNSIEFWLNLQATYDAALAEIKSSEELEKERQIFKFINYKYFVKYFDLPQNSKNIDLQIKTLRNFLQLSTLLLLTKKDLISKFRDSTDNLPLNQVIMANAMLQVGINQALQIEAVNFNKTKFKKSINFVDILYADNKLNFNLLKKEYADYYDNIDDTLLNSGVILTKIPAMPGTNFRSATKKLGSNIMLLINDTYTKSANTLDTIFAEMTNIATGNYGITLNN
ncbi:HigA family addiction module antitoxin [Veillonella sp. CAG:933]|uniref:HigA family addiction module antitoxin n=1 Tax=Veillonella sp. CAG:933 TaxID=1262980 RepID=UPI00033C3F61|nr:HigA family addiction module antitoxin [Veillonella sp. CAG:933]CCX53554.1 addiction module antidote protein HigA family [Veillonella sp. CAG:933]